MSTRTITGTVLDSAGNAATGTVRFVLERGTWSATEHAIPDETTATLTAGAFSVTIYTPARYKVYLPTGYHFSVNIPAGDATTLPTLRLANEDLPDLSNILEDWLAALTLDDVADVNAAAPDDGQALVWDATPGEWVPGDRTSISAGSGITASVAGVVTSIRQATYRERVLALYPDNLIQYLPLDETSGTVATDLSGNALHGTYSASGITYTQLGIGDAKGSVKFSGSDTYVLIGNAAFGAAWNGDKFSMVAWGKVDDATRWTDATSYRYLTHVRPTDVTYYVVMGKSTTSHQLEWRRRTGGPIVSATYTYTPTGPTDWFCMGMTFDIAAPVMKCYLNGQLIGTSTSANLTPWGANPPDGGAAVLMAGSLTLQEWFGWGANSAIWAGVVLSDDEMASIGRVAL
jgi:hypothetical protein